MVIVSIFDILKYGVEGLSSGGVAVQHLDAWACLGVQVSERGRQTSAWQVAVKTLFIWTRKL